MRAFMNKTGRLNILNCSHDIYCENVLKVSYTGYLKSNVRVLMYRETLAIETQQKALTADQLKAIRKIYRQEQCFLLVAQINKKVILDIKELSLN